VKIRSFFFFSFFYAFSSASYPIWIYLGDQKHAPDGAAMQVVVGVPTPLLALSLISCVRVFHHQCTLLPYPLTASFWLPVKVLVSGFTSGQFVIRCSKSLYHEMPNECHVPVTKVMCVKKHSPHF